MTVDPKSTALLVLDFVPQTCNEKRRPRCVASLPAVAKLLAAARKAGALVVYSSIPNGKKEAILPPVAPKGDEPFVASGVDKFHGTDLEKILKDHNIQTVIVTGTTAEGAVLYTASEAAIRGMKVVIPVDGMSASDLYPEQYVAWNMANAPVISSNVTLTTIDQLKF